MTETAFLLGNVWQKLVFIKQLKSQPSTLITRDSLTVNEHPKWRKQIHQTKKRFRVSNLFGRDTRRGGSAKGWRAEYRPWITGDFHRWFLEAPHFRHVLFQNTHLRSKFFEEVFLPFFWKFTSPAMARFLVVIISHNNIHKAFKVHECCFRNIMDASIPSIERPLHIRQIFMFHKWAETKTFNLLSGIAPKVHVLRG